VATKDYTRLALHLSKVTQNGGTAAVALLAVVMVVGTTIASRASTVSTVAAVNPRCNYYVAGTLERQVRSFDRHPPAQSPDALSQRYADLDSVLQQAQIERDILQQLCTSSEFPPIEDQLAGVAAWAYALQADIASKRFAFLKCPATATSASQALLADAWYALATTYDDPDRSTAPASPAPLVAEVTPKIRTRAAAVGFALPSLSDATQYWRDTVNGRVVACPTPSP
jgi:hypothetical protein